MRHVWTSCRDIARLPEGYDYPDRNHNLTQRDWKPALAQGTSSPAASDRLTPTSHETYPSQGDQVSTVLPPTSSRACVPEAQLKAVHVCRWVRPCSPALGSPDAPPLSAAMQRHHGVSHQERAW